MSYDILTDQLINTTNKSIKFIFCWLITCHVSIKFIMKKVNIRENVSRTFLIISNIQFEINTSGA